MLLHEVDQDFSCVIGMLCGDDLIDDLAAGLEQRKDVLVKEGLRERLELGERRG